MRFCLRASMTRFWMVEAFGVGDAAELEEVDVHQCVSIIAFTEAMEI